MSTNTNVFPVFVVTRQKTNRLNNTTINGKYHGLIIYLKCFFKARNEWTRSLRL